ncbi:MAG: MFS transporter [Thermoleophilia bacterium]|nr:MFS transporter [Thermoleophilia bacterium]
MEPGHDRTDRLVTHEEPAREPEPGDAGPHSGRKIWGLDRNVFWAGVSSFFMDISSEMVYSLVPVFLSSVLGVNKSLIGVIEGLAETTASLLKMFAGWLSDRLGRRKPLMLFGYSVSTLSRPLLALAGSWGMVLGARFVDRFGKGLRTAPRDAIVADSCDKKELGRSFGFHRAMDQFGAVIGPAVAFLVLTLRPGDYRTVFWISLIPGALCVLVIALFIRDRRRRVAAGGVCEDTGAGAGAMPEETGRRVPVPGAVAGRPGAEGAAGPGLLTRLRRLRGPLLAYLLVTAVFSLGNSSDAFLILRAQDLRVATVMIPVLYLMFNLVYSSLSIPAGLLADRIGRRRVALLGFAIFAGTYAWMALASSQAAAWGVFAVYGVYMAIADGNGRALLAEFSSGERHGTAFGAYHMVVGLAALPSSVIAGLLYDHVSAAAPFWLGAAGAVLAGILMLALVPEPRHALPV